MDENHGHTTCIQTDLQLKKRSYNVHTTCIQRAYRRYLYGHCRTLYGHCTDIVDSAFSWLSSLNRLRAWSCAWLRVACCTWWHPWDNEPKHSQWTAQCGLTRTREKSAPLKLIVLGRIQTVWAQVWRVDSQYDPSNEFALEMLCSFTI